MSFDPLTAGIDLAKDALDRIAPDKDKVIEAGVEDVKVAADQAHEELDSDTKIALAESATDKVEAASSDLFVSGWRPCMGWICDICLALYSIPQITFASAMWMYLCIREEKLLPFPMSISFIIAIATLLLGGHASRTFEKIKGVTR